jgi:hypothetical protein
VRERVSPLAVALAEVATELGARLEDLTVLAPQNDPFRLDTPANHRDGRWAGQAVTELLGDREIHNRGLHYAVLERRKPNGMPYISTFKDWAWIEKALKAGRWLGYVSFDQIIDQRNMDPVERIFDPPQPDWFVTRGIDDYLPDVDDIVPAITTMSPAGVEHFVGTQAFHLVFFGEKSSLEVVLDPLAEQYLADLYLPTGEISDTMLHRMAKRGATDGRVMIVVTFSDSDPAGWQMPVSIAHKLMALKILHFPSLKFQVYRGALTPAQVKAMDPPLPSSPLKDTELRGDRWQAMMGVTQTEIDALATLQPDVFSQIVRKSADAFFDHSLTERVNRARRDWVETAQRAIDDAMPEDWEQTKAALEERLARMNEEIDEINEALEIDLDDVDLPDMDIPTAEVTDSDEEPLSDSEWPLAEHIRQLRSAKAYEMDE